MLPMEAAEGDYDAGFTEEYVVEYKAFGFS
jgi:hypothetical protein